MLNLWGKLLAKTKRIKYAISMCLVFAITMSLLNPGIVHALQGDSGYEGGISSGDAPNKTSYQYVEPCFLTGTPIILSGTLVIKKSLKEDTKTKTQTLTTIYNYSLRNTDKNSTLTRALTFVTTITLKDNGQKTQTTQLTKATENLNIDGVTYRIASITDYELSKSILNDIKPAVNYYAGNLWSKKTYRSGNTTDTDTTVVESTGKYYGYDGYWSSTEAQLISQTVSLCKTGQEPVIIGEADIDISSATTKELKYYENKPDQISFDGGYAQSQKNENILKYTASLSEFDKDGQPTRKIVKFEDSLKLESFPTQSRLVSPNLNSIKGHPSEESMRLMFGIEAYKDAVTFNPQEYMSRAEFIDAFVRVAKEVPLDPVFTKKKSTSRTSKTETKPSLFSDITANSAYFDSITDAATRGITAGGGKSAFRPNDLITVAEAVTMMINSLGLEGLAPNPAPVTSFKDNDSIPSYARSAVYVAEKIGLIQEDSKGYIHPNDKITKARAADMMNSYISYMNSGIRSEYMDRLVSY